MANLLSVLLQLSVKVKLSTVSGSEMKGHVAQLELLPTAQLVALRLGPSIEYI